MKKFLSLILVLSMLLLPVSALASERNAVMLSVGNFELNLDGATLSLPVTLELYGGLDLEGERAMTYANLLAGENLAGSVYAAVENGEVKAYIDGMAYGLTVPTEDLVALLENEMDISLEDLLSGAAFSSELTDDFTRLGENLVAAILSSEQNSEKLLAGLGVTSTDMGVQTVEMFGEEVSSDCVLFTLNETSLYNLIAAFSNTDAAWAAFWDSYWELFLNMASESEETITQDDLNMLLQFISTSCEARVYTAEQASLTELEVSMTADDETIQVPISICSQTAETGSRSDVSVALTVDGETLQVQVTNDQSESSFDTSVYLDLYDAEDGQTSTLMSFDVSGMSAGNGSSRFAVDLYVLSDGEEASFSLAYNGNPASLSEEQDVYSGILNLRFSDGSSEFSIDMDAGLALFNMPEGELLSLSSHSINPFTADDDALEQFASDVQVPMMQAIGALMQVPEIAEIFSSMMSE